MHPLDLFRAGEQILVLQRLVRLVQIVFGMMFVKIGLRCPPT